MPGVCHHCKGPLGNEQNVCPFCGAQIAKDVQQAVTPTIHVNLTSNYPRLLVVAFGVIVALVAGLTAFLMSGDDEIVRDKPASPTPNEVTQYSGHTKGVTSVAFSSDGTTFVSGSEDTTLRVWDMTTGQCLHVLRGHTDIVTSARFSRDGRRLVSTSWDETVRLWDPLAGIEKKTIGESTRSADKKFTLSVVFTVGDRQLLIADSGSQLVLFDPTAEQEVNRLRGHTGAVNCVAISTDGRLAASASSDRTVRTWNLDTGTPRHRLEGHSNVVNSVVISRDGQRVLSGSSDRTVRLWDANTGQGISKFEGHSDAVLAVAILPHGTQALSASADKTIRLWNVKRGVELHRFEGHTGEVTSIAVSADGKRVLSGSADKTVRIWALPDS